MVVEQAEVIRGNVEVGVGETDEESVVDDVVVNALENDTFGLSGLTRVLAHNLEWGVGDVELTDPSDESRSGGLVRNGRDVRVVGADVHSGAVPLKRDVSASVGEGRSLSVDGGLRVFGRKGDVVGDVQVWEDLPSDLGVVIGTSDDVSRKEGPAHGLGDTGLEVQRHGESSRELPESHLLSSLGGDRLEEQSGGGSRVEMRQEAVDTGLSPSGQSLTEVDKLSRTLKVVSVLALLGGGSTTLELHVTNEPSVRDFLVSHKVDEIDVILGDTGFGELFGGKSGCTIVEQVQLDPLLVQSDIERLEVEVAQRCINGRRVIRPHANTSIGDGGRSRSALGQ